MHQGLLFTREFLRFGITETDAWNALSDADVAAFRSRAVAIFGSFPVSGNPNEAHTEVDLIFKILEALDWAHYLPQQSASVRRRSDIPDALLFADAEAKVRANAERSEAARYRHGVAVIENKAWRLPLDRAPRARDLADGVPSTQILRYLSLAEVQSDRRIQWGILTNGEHWRLYYQLARSRAREQGFLHWEIAFPDVWDNWDSTQPSGGFDAIIGNPPWDRLKMQEVEWFAARRREIAMQQRASDRERMIADLKQSGDSLAADYERARNACEAATEVARSCGDYPLLSGGDVNIYSLFVERALSLIQPNGLVGLLVPSGIASDKSASKFFRSVSITGRLAHLYDFENRRPPQPHFFPDVDSRFKFCAMVVGGKTRHSSGAHCAFFLRDVVEIEDDERAFTLKSEDFAAINPNTGTAPVFRSRHDAELTAMIYSRCPVLVDRSSGGTHAAYPVDYLRMFDMTNDSGLFRTEAELTRDGFYRVAANRWRRGSEDYASLYEGKMVQAFDHRAASVVVNPENQHRPAQPEPASHLQHADPNWLPKPQFWVLVERIIWPEKLQWALGFKDVTSPTNARTVIAAAVPFSGFGNKLPILMPLVPPAPTDDDPMKAGQHSQECAEAVENYKDWAVLLLANLNSFALDYVARQKVHGQTLNLFIVEQFPIIPSSEYGMPIGNKTARDVLKREVLALTYVSHDMTPFARDMGYSGAPFPWDEERRRHSRARLDALFFRLYGLDRDAAGYILDTFPIVREADEDAFGRFRTKDLILGYMAAFAAGDTDSIIAA